ncbi:pickpocket protein 28-like isoform X2 [Cimex lectularius]|uniref:Pickpocket n=1 Tax=Cimex lectularius TaxID=79782 RepID=A0A8I6SKG5_CIMLE|nr:pickpocket protein 28-like isoform X2 [Cimex lectularius]
MNMKGRLLFFLKNSNIHGLKYTVEDIGWTQRLFWILSCTLAAIYMVVWCRASWQRFKYKPVDVVQETSYLHWNSSFPAISVCESDADIGAVAELADKLYGKDHDPDLETFLRDIVYFEGNCYSCQNLCEKTLNCTDNFEDMLNKVYIHSEEDVPFLNHPLQEKELVILGTKICLTFQMAEVNNDPALYRIPINIRKCKFPKEGGLAMYDHYSYSACVVECRAAAQLDLCTCVHHFMPKLKNDTRNTCGISGLECLTRFSRRLGTLKTPESSIDGLTCNCPSSCNELDTIIVSKSAQGNPADFSDITIKMESLPKSRFKRFVSLTNLEFAVYLGGILGLNFGASLLSIVETVYFIFIRRMDDQETQTIQKTDPRTDET